MGDAELNSDSSFSRFCSIISRNKQTKEKSEKNEATWIDIVWKLDNVESCCCCCSATLIFCSLFIFFDEIFDWMILFNNINNNWRIFCVYDDLDNLWKVSLFFVSLSLFFQVIFDNNDDDDGKRIQKFFNGPRNGWLNF